VKKQPDLEENIFGFVDISHRRYKLRRDVEQTPGRRDIKEVFPGGVWEKPFEMIQ
jgi:hypothetical protein